MSWSTLPPDLRELAERVCTGKEVDALKLKAAGYGRRRIAVILGIGETSVRDRIRGGERKILVALEQLDGDSD